MANQINNIVTNIEKSSHEMEIVIINLNTTIENTVYQLSIQRSGFSQKIDNLNATIIKLNTAGIKLNENLEALKQNWLLRGNFKKIEKEKEI